MPLFEGARAAALAGASDLRIEQALQIVDAYGAALEAKREPIADTRELPYPKDTIKWAMLVLLGAIRDAAQREPLRAGYVSLAEWQDRAALESFGFDSARLRRRLDPLALANEFASRTTAEDRWLAASRAEQSALIGELRARGFW
jgi:hypothetical protein